ncbi:MAG TPA: UDP-3-O-(3-hydroxymyristoyl)glucosamine N-acyltransferase [Cellvibrionaceae bacterium]
MTQLTLQEIAEYLSAVIDGDAGLIITGIAGLNSAKSEHISFLANPAYLDLLGSTEAGAVILTKEHAEGCSRPTLIVDEPYLAYAKLSRLFDPALTEVNRGVHPSAVIADSVVLGKNILVGPHVTIAENVTIADGVSIGPGSSIGARTSIGANTRIAANVSIYHDVFIGESCIFHSGCVVGSDGFGFAPDKINGGWCKIHQLGSVNIGNKVEVGACTAIDRGALGSTELHDGVIIDNQVHIAHNCIIGENTAIAANCAIAGSTRIGRNCTLAGAVGVTGHIEIADNTHFSGMSMVTKSLSESGSYSSGTGILPTREWRKNAVRFSQLNDLAARVKALEKVLKEHEKK